MRIVIAAIFFSYLSLSTVSSAQQLDVLVWMDSQLRADQYVGVHAQHRPLGESTWTASTSVYQPFKTMVNREAKQIYWRKDSIDLSHDYYGELFTYDADYIYLRSETFPVMPDREVDVWDERIDRFRVFDNSGNNVLGRVIAPRTVEHDWDYSQTVDTYMCGVSTADDDYVPLNGFMQVNEKSCPLYQRGVQDTSVTVSIVNGFDLLEDGPLPVGTPTSLPKGTSDGGEIRFFEQVLIIEQVMFDSARERFIFGYAGGKYYGIIRWDSSVRNSGEWTVTDRTVGLRIINVNAGSFGFHGMIRRGYSDQNIIPSKPTSLETKCITNSNDAIVSWAAVPGAEKYMLRINDLDDGDEHYSPGAGSMDIQLDAHSGASYIFTTVPGHRYDWWVQAANDAGSSDPAGTSPSPWTSSCDGNATAAPTAAPAGLSATCLGNIITLSWDDAPNTTSYDVRVYDKTAGQWNPASLGVNDRMINGYKSTSYTFKVKNAYGHLFDWWLNTRNAVGAGPTAGGPTTACANYPAPP